MAELKKSQAKARFLVVTGCLAQRYARDIHQDLPEVDAVLGTALGLFVSAFAQTEFQAVQFMPAVVVPQMLLCGLLVPRDLLPGVLSSISDVLPLSYAVDAMQELVRTDATGEVWKNVGIVAAFAVAGLALGAATLRRRTA